MFRNILHFIFFTSIGAVILYFLWQSQTAAYHEECRLSGISISDCSLARKLIVDYRQSDFFWLFIISVFFMLSNLVRAARWQLLCAPLGHSIRLSNSFFAIMVGFFANTGIPRIGEFLRAGIIRKYEKVPFEKALGTIIMGRIMDLFCLMVMIGLGFLFHYNKLWAYIQDNLHLPKGLAIMVFSIGAVVGIAGILFLRWLNNQDDDDIHPSLIRVKYLAHGFIEGLISIRKTPRLPLFLFYSALIWLCYYLMHYLAFFAYEPTSHLSAIDGLLVFDFGSLGVVFPSPGGMGSYHAMIVEALKILGVPPLNGFSFAMITFFTLSIFCNVAFGMLSLILLPVFNRNKGDT